MASQTNLPSRLHHTAYVSKDLEATRRFYEDLIGLPLIATWCEADELFGKERVYCHCFFGIGDGGALAFFQFADPEDQALFGPEMPQSPFHHLALKTDAETQGIVKRRLEAAGYEAPNMYVLEHGYCTSLYVVDPNGMTIELTEDAPGVEAQDEARRATAHADLARWLSGDRHSNNGFR